MTVLCSIAVEAKACRAAFADSTVGGWAWAEYGPTLGAQHRTEYPGTTWDGQSIFTVVAA